MAGRRRDVWSQQDTLLLPGELAVEAGHLVFLREAQNVVRWGIRVEDCGRDDPPVHMESPDEPGRWLAVNESTSEFVLAMTAYVAKFSSHLVCWANGAGDPTAFQRAQDNYSRLGFDDWRSIIELVRFYGGDAILIETQGDSDWLWVSAMDRDEFRKFEALIDGIGVTWESCSEEDGPPAPQI